ncbi:SgrR family transcriptional regulator [Cohnella nanjingensis]|uniref:SgrR family transcriptional regulator n=1 Tax=Cohnella nanjingensis TaxID=1387779 RepID=A0A7X0RTL4_9BACL|nr:SgrR family transcriptional regulator [Cohnella nanjingensis]
MDLFYHPNLPLPQRNKLRQLLEDRFGFQRERSDAATADILRVTMGCASACLDPAFVSTSTEAFLLQRICDTLTVFDPRKKTHLPSLAQAWENNEDGSNWTFYLRKGVRFHHGRTLTTKDVLYTVQRLRDVNSPSRWQYEEIERVEIVSDFAISFYLLQPNRLFLHFFSSFYMSILPHDVAFSERNLIGTGPFRMAEFTDRVLVLEAYDDYFRERPFLDRVEFWFMPVHMEKDLYQLPDANPAKLDGHGDNGEIESVMDGCQFIVFNFRKEGVQRHRSFRKAMRLVFDRAAIIEELKGNRISPADSFFPENSKQTDVEKATLQEAKALLRESGYAAEELKLYYWNKKEFHDDARWIRNRGEAVGLRLSLHPVHLTDYYTTDADQEADMLVICESLEEDTEWGYLRLFQDEACFIRRLLDREQHAWLDRSIRSLAMLISPEQRARILDQIERRMRDEDWVLFGYHMNKITQYHPALHGVTLDSFGWIDFSKLWIKKEMLAQTGS